MKKRVFSLVLALLLCVGLAAPVLAAEKQEEVPITWLDANRKDAFPISYDEESNLLFFYNQDTHSAGGVIDLSKGVNYTYSRIGHFRDGLAPVCDVVTDQWGYINKKGEMVIPPQYVLASSFSDGWATVAVENVWNREIIDTSGQPMPLPAYPLPMGITEGLIAVSGMDDKYGFTDTTGQMVIPAEFDGTNGFSEGLAAVCKMDAEGNKKWGYINNRGDVVISLQYSSAESFSDGLARVAQNNQWTYIDKNGQVVLPLNYEYRYDAIFCDGLILGKNQDNKYGYLNKKGEVVIPFDYTDAKDFSDGLALVYDTQWKYIDTSGRVVLSDKFQSADSFLNGMASVRKDGKLGLIDKTGKMAIPTSYAAIGCLGKYEAKDGYEAGIMGWVKDKDERIGIFKLPNSMLGTWIGDEPLSETNIALICFGSIAGGIVFLIVALMVAKKKKAAPAPVAAPTAGPAPVEAPDVTPAPVPAAVASASIPPSSVAPAPAPTPAAEPPRFCSNCGKPLAPGVNFCSSCGYNVKDGEG